MVAAAAEASVPPRTVWCSQDQGARAGAVRELGGLGYSTHNRVSLFVGGLKAHCIRRIVSLAKTFQSSISNLFPKFKSKYFFNFRNCIVPFAQFMKML